MKSLINKIPKISNSTQFLWVFYGLIAIKLHFLDFSLVPDESSFMRISKEMQWLQSPSPEYFGQLFWLLLKGISKFTPFFLFGLVAKFIFGGLLFLSFLSCIYFSEDKRRQFYCTALALTSPLFYWNGKIIGPEVFSVSLIFFALALHSKNKDKLAFLLIGLAVGVKLTVFPVLIYVLLSKFLKNFHLNSLIYCLALSCFGFFIANPTDNYSLIYRVMVVRADTSAVGFQQLYLSFFDLWGAVFNFHPDHNWTWDLSLNNSFQDLAFSWFTCFLILFSAMIFDRRLFFCYLSFLASLFIFIIKGSGGGFPWYWMSMVPVSIHVFSHINLEQKIFNTKYFSTINLGLVIILCSFLQSSPVIVAEIHQKQYQKQNITDFGKDYTCFKNSFKKDDLEIVTRVSLEPRFYISSRIGSIPMYDKYSVDNATIFVKDFYLLISSRFLYADTPSQNILKNKNKLLGRCGDILIFRIFSSD